LASAVGFFATQQFGDSCGRQASLLEGHKQ